MAKKSKSPDNAKGGQTLDQGNSAEDATQGTGRANARADGTATTTKRLGDLPKLPLPAELGQAADGKKPIPSAADEAAVNSPSKTASVGGKTPPPLPGGKPGILPNLPTGDGAAAVNASKPNLKQKKQPSKPPAKAAMPQAEKTSATPDKKTETPKKSAETPDAEAKRPSKPEPVSVAAKAPPRPPAVKTPPPAAKDNAKPKPPPMADRPAASSSGSPSAGLAKIPFGASSQANGPRSTGNSDTLPASPATPSVFAHDGNAALAAAFQPTPLSDDLSELGQRSDEVEQPSNHEPSDDVDARRKARRRPAGPPRNRIAANDDAPSIGGLIYALNQRPSHKPFVYAAAGSGFWIVVALTFAFAFLPNGLTLSNGIAGVVANPWFPTLIATIAGPIALFAFLAMLAWRTEELHMRSTAMTEVAVRLAEPDRMAEQSVASLGQAVRRQVTFMNDAVSRALGRAGELEALVHNEVSALEQSYEDNERKIRGLINELAGERHSLINTGEHFEATLQKMSVEIPTLMQQLSEQQLKLTSIIDDAGTNLGQLETALADQTGQLESTLGNRSTELQTVLGEYTEALGGALDARTVGMGEMLGGYTEALGTALGSRTDQLQTLLEDKRKAIDTSVTTLSTTVEERVSGLQQAVEENTGRINQTLTERTETLQTVFEEYALALDTTLANRAEALDSQLVERTKSLDEAFSERLKLFDESVLRSTMAIDSAVGENTKTLTNAMEVHARQLGDSIASQAAELDSTLMHGINSVRETSENISRQSIKAIEGLANQSDLLRNVSENLLNQIHSVTSRFENQGQVIMRSANALESTNYKIEQSLVGRTDDLNKTLDRMSTKADELGRVVEGYSSSLEGSLTGAEQRARMIAQEISKETEARSRTALDDLERVKLEASRETDKALEELRNEFANVSREVTQRLGSLTTQFSSATGAVREQAASAARDLEQEQARLKHQLDRLPSATEETANQMRRALNDQLRALDQLSSMVNRSGLPDVTLPANQAQLPPPRRPGNGGPSNGSNGRGLSSLTSSLAQEISQRNARNTAAANQFAKSGNAGKRPAQGGNAQDAWSLGDLLARASDGNSASDGPPQQPMTAPPRQASPAPASGGGQPAAGLDINALSRALDATTAATIWSRFQSGQRGFMVRSIYAPESRNLFDGIARRFRADDNFKSLVDRFLNEYQSELAEADARDPSGGASQQLIQSSTGRVYLVLAHASGRLS